MKSMLALVATMLVMGVASAQQHSHGEKGPNGGAMEDVAGVHAELIAAGTTITINVYDEASKPIATTGFSASALVTRGSNRETVKLEPSGANALVGSAKTPVAGATIAVTLRTAAGKSGQARFRP